MTLAQVAAAPPEGGQVGIYTVLLAQAAAPSDPLNWTAIVLGLIGLVSTLGMGWIAYLTQDAIRDAAALQIKIAAEQAERDKASALVQTSIAKATDGTLSALQGQNAILSAAAIGNGDERTHGSA